MTQRTERSLRVLPGLGALRVGRAESAWTLRVACVGASTDDGVESSLAAQVGRLAAFRGYGQREASDARSLERAAEEICAMVLGVYPAVERVEVSVDALGEVVHHRQVRDVFDQEEAVFGHVDILVENDEAGLYLLHVAPGRGIPRHHHERMRELEWRVCGELARDGRPMTGSEAMEWPKGQVHGYENLGTTLATLFCCDEPAFIREDEIYETPPEPRVEPNPEPSREPSREPKVRGSR